MFPKLVSSALFAVVLASGQGVTAFGASSPAPDRAAGIAAAQSRSAAAGLALGLGSGEKLVVKDVIVDPDGSTHVRYNRTFAGLRVIGGDLVSDQDKAGKLKSVSWNASPNLAVSSTTPKLSLAAAKATGATKAASVQKTRSASAGELVVFAGDASPKAIPKLAYDVVTEGVRADQTPSRLHTIVDANTGATLQTWDEIQNGTGNGIFVGTVPIGTTAGAKYSMTDAVGNYTTDLNGSTSGTGTTFTDADDIWGNGAVSNRASAGVDAHYGAGKTGAAPKLVIGSLTGTLFTAPSEPRRPSQNPQRAESKLDVIYASSTIKVLVKCLSRSPRSADSPDDVACADLPQRYAALAPGGAGTAYDVVGWRGLTGDPEPGIRSCWRTRGDAGPCRSRPASGPSRPPTTFRRPRATPCPHLRGPPPRCGTPPSR